MEAQKKSIKKTSGPQKIRDTGSDVSSGSRADQYWKRRGFDVFFKKFRVPALNIESIIDINNPEPSVLRKFNLKALEFGNWVTNEDRFNYLGGLIIALYDLNKVLRFNFNIGLDKHLSVAFGSRGRGRALAHYEPWSDVINLTRYSKDAVATTKIANFLNTGGVGSLAHEYGHFLDYFFGTYVEPTAARKSITLGHLTSTRQWENYPRNSYRSFAQDVIRAIIFKKPGVYSDYYLSLQKAFKQDEYWFRHNELFARAFEQYISQKLQGQNVNNRFLAKSKYASSAYMKTGDLMRVMPLMDKLISKMSAFVRS